MAWGSVLLGNTTIDALDRWPMGVSSAIRKLEGSLVNFRVARHSAAEVLRCPADCFASLRFPRNLVDSYAVLRYAARSHGGPMRDKSTTGPLKSHPPSISFDHGKYSGSNSDCGVRTGAREQHCRRCGRAEHRGGGPDQAAH